MSTQAINPKPGDVMVLASARGPQRVPIVRVTQTQAIDAQGHRWRLSDGRLVGEISGGYHGFTRIRPWTAEDDRAERRAAEHRQYCAALERLGARGGILRLPTPDQIVQALPHLLAAVAVLGGE